MVTGRGGDRGRPDWLPRFPRRAFPDYIKILGILFVVLVLFAACAIIVTLA